MQDGKMHRHCVRFGLLLLGTWFFVACQQGPSTVLMDTSCPPPCWNLITPGQSTRQEVLDRLPTLPEVDSSSIHYNVVDNQRSNVAFDFTSRVADSFAIILFSEDRVVTIILGVGGLTFGEAIEKLGDPEQLFASCEAHDSRGLSIDLLYPSKGVMLTYVDHNWRRDELAAVESDDPVVEVTYFDSAQYEELIASVGLIPEYYDTIQKGLTPWQGFGPVAKVMPCSSP